MTGPRATRRRAGAATAPAASSSLDALDALAQQALASGLVHEVRGRLNVVATHAALLERTLGRAPGSVRAGSTGIAPRRSLASIAEQVARIDRILQRYLGAVGAAADAVRPEARHELAAVVRRAVALARPRASRRKVALRLLLGTGPASAGVDPARLLRALGPLVENAVEATAPGGAVLVRTRHGAETGQLVIEVEDHGAGVPSDVQPQLFQIGFTTRAGRRGVGLAVAKHLLAGHGVLSIESAPGRTVLRVTLHGG